ncbi:hypothetical protein G9A89_002237 [Geosiphon pyriformis]|nr:hypothetical protein G9A89_002237 [Geosiphon pyriformis]
MNPLILTIFTITITFLFIFSDITSADPLNFLPVWPEYNPSSSETVLDQSTIENFYTGNSNTKITPSTMTTEISTSKPTLTLLSNDRNQMDTETVQGKTNSGKTNQATLITTTGNSSTVSSTVSSSDTNIQTSISTTNNKLPPTIPKGHENKTGSFNLENVASQADTTIFLVTIIFGIGFGMGFVMIS